ncbi:MAG TPA: M1 family metallopeptidase [Nocardioides sp.]|nr:M1 family metallopeptidase [Nocardioides sp.]
MPGDARSLAAGLALLGLVAAGCGSGSGSGGAAPAPRAGASATDTHGSAYDAAVSEPREDTVYPQVGDPGVDALHYTLDLAWDDRATRLTGTETMLFRATRSADHVRLDLASQLLVGHVWLDGTPVSFDHSTKDLVVSASVTAGSRHVLQVTYGGTPEPVTAPTDRADFSTTGWTVAQDGTVWTMQEPFGAYSWYAVNDQPSDKAFYDFTIHAPAGKVGVANGELRSRRTTSSGTTTRWRLPEPAASYLVTIAIGRFTETQDTGPHDLPITYWTPSGQPAILREVRYAPQAVRYLEGLVGRYPFPTLGILVVPAMSAMETQSMVTLGTSPYTLSRDVITHEIAHQWYGDTVTPADWSDLWMNEGMATYLAEANWTGDHGPHSREDILQSWSRFAPGLRLKYGAPTHYRPGTFGEGNVYYIPALMWDTIRQRLGDDEFWSLATRWLQTHRYTSQDRDTLVAWWSKESGQDLSSLFDAWLEGTREPAWEASS